MGKTCRRLTCAQEKTLSAERSTQVPRVPKRNSEILADTFSRAQTFYFSFAFAFENGSRSFDSADARSVRVGKPSYGNSYRPANGYLSCARTASATRRRIAIVSIGACL